MTIINATRHAAEAVPYENDVGAEVVVAIVKATFELDARSRAWVPAGDPSPVRLGDAPTYPDRDRSSVRYPSDVAHAKAATDVLFVGDAVSARPVRELEVAVSIRERRLTLRVHGERLWGKSAVSYVPSRGAPFERQPIEWELAWGGTLPDGSDLDVQNPVGRGADAKPGDLEGKPAPCIEDVRRPIRSDSDHGPPAGLGVVPMHWQPRLALAGTFDEAWRTERMPLPPRDRSPRFQNVAPEALQIDPPLAAGEAIACTGMRLDERLSNGALVVELPAMPIAIFGKTDGGATLTTRPHVDTVLIEPGRGRMELTLRQAFRKGRGPTLLREIRVQEA